MKHFVLVAVTAAALVAAAPALAAHPNPWKSVGAPSSGKAWDVRQPSQAKGWTDVRLGSKAWDVRARYAPNPWKVVRADWTS